MIWRLCHFLFGWHYVWWVRGFSVRVRRVRSLHGRKYIYGLWSDRIIWLDSAAEGTIIPLTIEPREYEQWRLKQT